MKAMHIVSASVMSAPAALVMSKLIYPELETPIITYPFISSVKGEYVYLQLSADANSYWTFTVSYFNSTYYIC